MGDRELLVVRPPVVSGFSGSVCIRGKGALQGGGWCALNPDQGKRLNSPNDVVVKSDGSIWFTDPTYGIDGHYEGDKADSEIGGSFVFRVAPKTLEVVAVATDFVKPNGLAFSPDESKLYIADTGATHDRLFICATNTLYSAYLNTQGAIRPAQPHALSAGRFIMRSASPCCLNVWQVTYTKDVIVDSSAGHLQKSVFLNRCQGCGTSGFKAISFKLTES